MLIDTPIGQYLIAKGHLTEDQLGQALEYQEARGIRLGSAVVELGYASIGDVSDALSKQLCVPSLTPSQVQRDRLDFSLLSPLQAVEIRALPYRVFRRTILVGLEDPHNRLVISELEKLTGRRVKPAVVLSSCLDSSLKELSETQDLHREPKRTGALTHHASEISRPDEAGPLNEGEPVESETILSPTQAKRLHQARRCLRQALTSLAGMKYQEALDGLNESLSLDPFDARTHYHRGRTLAEMGELVAAEQSFLNALSLNGQDTRAWCALGVLLESQSRIDDAVDAWIRAEDTSTSPSEREEIRAHLTRIQSGRQTS